MYIFKNSYYWVTGEKNNIRLIIYLVDFFYLDSAENYDNI